MKNYLHLQIGEKNPIICKKLNDLEQIIFRGIVTGLDKHWNLITLLTLKWELDTVTKALGRLVCS
jgi:hypothetical protein